MASTSKLAFVIVLMCVIVPVGAGYLLPSGTSEHTVSESTDTTDLTARLNNSTRPIYVEYTGDDNNYYYIEDYGSSSTGTQQTFTKPVVPTTSVNGHPVYSEFQYWTSASGTTAKQILISGEGQTVESVLKANIGSYAFLWVSDFVYNGSTYQLAYYRSGEAALFDSIYNRTVVDASSLGNLGNTPYYAWGMYHVLDNDTNNQPLYWDPDSYAELTPAEESIHYTWYNGRSNASVQMIVRPEYATSFKIIVGQSEADYAGDNVGIMFGLSPTDLTDNRYYLRSYGLGLDGSQEETTLASYNAVTIPYILIEIDGLNGEITVTNLADWDGTGSFDSYRAVSVTYSYTTSPITSVNAYTRSSFMAVRVPSVMAALYTDPAMEDVTIETANYYPGGYLLQFSNVAYYGDSITVRGVYSITDVTGTHNETFSGTYTADWRTGTIKDVPVTIFDSDGTFVSENVDIPVSGLKLYCIETDAHHYQVRFNDYIWGHIMGLTSAVPLTVTMNGTWDADVVIMKMESSTSTEYEWEPGAWSLDWNTFCIVGMATAFLSFLVCVLTGRMSGVKMGALMVVSGICGLAYLAIYL